MTGRRLAWPLAIAGLVLAGSGIARAQPAPILIRNASPLIVRSPITHGASSQHPIPLLTPDQLRRFQQAQALRDAGLLDQARDLLLGLLREVPHHPQPVTELGEIYATRHDWTALERLGRTERLAVRDSLLLASNLALALERLGRPRDAALVEIEAWMVSPAERIWVSPGLRHLAAADAPGVRSALERASLERPDRTDVANELAAIAWNTGQTPLALRALAAAERAGARTPPARWGFAEELLRSGIARDSSGAMDALLDLAGDPAADASYRVAAARRVWEVFAARDARSEGAPRVRRALKDLPTARWGNELLVGVVRGLREAGLTSEARALLSSLGPSQPLIPELALERALADLRDGPAEKALPALAQGAVTLEGKFRYAEALFFAGQSDSALVWYQRVAETPTSPYAGPALERAFLIEDANDGVALSAFGRVAYESWRGDLKRAVTLADSLLSSLERGPLWAQAAVELASLRERAGDAKGALIPLLAVADSLPDDRLASIARERAGDLYLSLKDEPKALAQFEDCVTRYPRAWNAPAVRRKLEQLRRERRF